MVESLNFRQMNWNFTIFPPREAVALYANTLNPSEGLAEAYRENLPLIEIYIRDYRNPLHTVITPNVDMDYLKKKWCIDYCTYHNLVVRYI